MASHLALKLSAERTTLRRLGIFSLALIFGWAVFFVYVVHASLPPNAIHLPFANLTHAKFWMPEHWSFFTADSRAESIVPFKRQSDGKWVSAALSPNLKASNLFGIRRGPRRQGIEISFLLNSAPDGGIQPCTEAPALCLERLPVAGSMANTFPRPTLCGDVGFVMQKPVPWAWKAAQEGTGEIIMPSRVIRVNVLCS